MLKKNTIYIIIIVLVIILLILGGYFLLLKKGSGNGNGGNKAVLPGGGEVNQEIVKSGAVLSIIPAEGKYKVGDELTADVYLESGDKVSGVDVVISYDKDKLGVIGRMVSKEKSVFSTWPENKAGDGKIKFSALTVPGKFFSGKGKVATIYFKALKNGKANVKFSFDKDKQSVFDCNVASQGKDILKEVKNAVYEIK